MEHEITVKVNSETAQVLKFLNLPVITEIQYKVITEFIRLSKEKIDRPITASSHSSVLCYFIHKNISRYANTDTFMITTLSRDLRISEPLSFYKWNEEQVKAIVSEEDFSFLKASSIF